MDIEALRKRFERPGRIEVGVGRGGLAFVRVGNRAASAEVCLQGAHLLSYRPAAQREDLLWMCPAACFAPGKAIRGGVPVCWPWFGRHPTDPAMPSHGFARLLPWDLLDVRTPADDLTVLALGLRDGEATRRYWDHPFSLRLEISVGAALGMALTTENPGDAPFTVGEALHTYFNVSGCGDVQVEGLEGRRYFDKTAGTDALRTQDGILRIVRETDSVFQGFEGPVAIHDPGFRRTIRIEKEGSGTTVVWNPWIEKSREMADFTPDSYLTMLCVEAANALDDVILLPPGGKHTIRFQASV